MSKKEDLFWFNNSPFSSSHDPNNNNTVPSPQPQQQSSFMSHQNQHLSYPFTNNNHPLSNGFSYWEDQKMIFNNYNDNDHHQQLSLDLSALTLSEENHHHQGNRKRSINGYNNVFDSNMNMNMNMNMNRFCESRGYNNIVQDETVTPATNPRYHQNMGYPNSAFGVSVSQGLVSDMHKVQNFGLSPQMGSSIDHGNNVSYGQGHGRGNVSYSRGRVVPVQVPNLYEQQQQRVMFSSPSSSFAMQNDLGWDVATNQLMYTAPQTNVNNVPSSHLYYPSRPIEEPLAFKCDNSVIIQENGIKRECNSFLGCVPGCTKAIPQISYYPCRDGNNTTRTFVSDDDYDNDDDHGDYGQQSMKIKYGPHLSELQIYMFNMAKDQNGCRFLQSMVAEGTVEDMEIVFNGVIENVVDLMMDPFGNYLVQKLLDFCREDQRLEIVLRLTKEPGQLVRTSLNTHGTRVVQKLISTLKSKKQIALVRSAIIPGFLDLTKDLNGNHVIQRCLSSLSLEDNEFIYDAAIKFLSSVAKHQHGCCVLQRCIEFSKGESEAKLVREICKHGYELAKDQYGNYVVQYIIEMQNPSALTKMTNQFKGNYVELSKEKFSSHVVEKCIKHIPETRSRIVQELLCVPNFETLLQDPYANYVVQSALEHTKGTLHANLVDEVRAHKILRTSPYCKRIFSKNMLKK